MTQFIEGMIHARDLVQKLPRGGVQATGAITKEIVKMELTEAKESNQSLSEYIKSPEFEKDCREASTRYDWDRFLFVSAMSLVILSLFSSLIMRAVIIERIGNLQNICRHYAKEVNNAALVKGEKPPC